MNLNTSEISRINAAVRFVPLTNEMIDELIEVAAEPDMRARLVAADMRQGDLLGVDAEGAPVGFWREL